MDSKYVYDDSQVTFKEAVRGTKNVVFTILVCFFASIAISVVYYFVASLFFSTDVEHRLKRENSIYAKVYPELVKKDRMLADVISGLQIRDDEIYGEIFNASAPNVDLLSSVGLFSSDANVEEDDVVITLNSRLSSLEASADRVEENMSRVFDKFCEDFYMMPPMNAPLKDFTASSTGASVGTKISPFFKVNTEHKGLDMVMATGTSVYAAGPGVVTSVVKSSKGQGNVVEITHFGGYTTRYAHLDAITVTRGKKVDEETVIGRIGNSGMSFAPHLHYEVLKDGQPQDPVNYFFRTLSPQEYVELLVMSVMIKQTME